MVKVIFDEGKFEAVATGLQNVVKNFNQQIYEAVFDSLLDIRATAIKPGYAPVDTGTLKRSITQQIERGAEMIVGIVGSNLPYARIQEYGGTTPTGGKIKPSLYLTRGAKENQKAIRERFRKYLSIANPRKR